MSAFQVSIVRSFSFLSFDLEQGFQVFSDLQATKYYSFATDFGRTRASI